MSQAAAAAALLGAVLDGWFERLDGQGFRVGLRERLLVQALLARLAADGELPPQPQAMLALAAPLLCASREQQRRYATLLQGYLADDVAAGGASATLTPVPKPRWRMALAALALALVLGAVVSVSGWWWFETHRPPPPPPTLSKPEPDVAQPPQASASAAQFYVPPAALPLQPGLAPAWSPWLRGALLVLGVLSAAGVVLALGAGRRRQMALQGVRTDDELEHHLLHDAAPVDASPHPVLARAVARALRQRVAGETLALDLPATLRATVAAQGAFSPRWRELQRTPEYLVLIDTRHAADHHAACALLLVDALARAGVTLQVFAFDTTPATGCWVRGAIGNDDAATRQRLPVATLVTRAARSRLLVFGPADALLNPATGELQPWAAPLRMLAERAWFTPVPMHAWGEAERAADAAGFLMLPLQEAALPTLAGWLTSNRLTLALDPDTPQSLPALLHGSALEWVTRTDAPPPDTVLALMQQLRRMLGGMRFQWLAACAVFPALTPPLTLALGQRILDDPRALALGLAALSALPWFRYGRMPQWLRRELLQQLAPDLRKTLEDEVRQRLDGALAAGDASALADVATKRRRLLAALGQRRGPLQDVVLADFVREGLDPDLAQKLPEGLRRRIFKNGDPGAGVRPGAMALPVAAVLAAVVAATPAWDAMVGEVAQPALAALPGVFHAWGALAVPDSFDPLRSIGETLFRNPAEDIPIAIDFTRGVAGAAPARVEMRPAAEQAMQTLPARSPEGMTIDLTGGRLQLHDAAARPVGAPLATGGVKALKAAFTPSGSRVVAVMADGSVRSWGRPWPTGHIDVVGCANTDVATGRAYELAGLLAGGLGLDGWQTTAYTATGWAVLNPDAGAPPAEGEIGYPDEQSSAIVQAVIGALNLVPPGQVASRWEPKPGLGVANTIAIGACAAPTLPTQPPVPDLGGLDAAATAEIVRRVNDMFSPDANTRKAATEALASDRERLSDAVPVAVSRALDALTYPDFTPESSGVDNVLVLLQSAPPRSLNRARAEIAGLTAKARGNGASTLKQATLLQQRMDAVAALQPTVYLQIASEQQRPLAEALAQRLKANKLQAAGIEVVGDRAPLRTSELRVQGFSDRRTARALRDAAGSVLGQAAKVVALAATPANDTYEIWLAGDLCVQRKVAGCSGGLVPASSPAASAPASVASAPAVVASEPALAPYAAAATPFTGNTVITGNAFATAFTLIARFEGFKALPYLYADKRYAVGFGHPLNDAEMAAQQVIVDGKPHDLSQDLSVPDALTLLKADVAPAAAAVAKMVTVPLNDNQAAALISLAYNVGSATLGRSSLLKQLNAGDYASVPQQMMQWASVAGQPQPGLKARREAEAALWNTPTAAAAAKSAKGK